MRSVFLGATASTVGDMDTSARPDSRSEPFAFFLGGVVGYARHYGTHVTYGQTGVVAYGRPGSQER